MCIYCNTKNYRKIYENHYGFIPKDDEGRSYDIHHIDGNHNNNNPNNLTCVSIQEHYEIHHTQSDWGACQSIAMRMALSPTDKSRLSTLSNLQRVSNGTHNFLGGDVSRKTQLRRVKEGTHHFLGGKISGCVSRERVKNGTHNLLKTGCEHPQHDNTIYTLYNTDGRIFVGTQYVFRQTYPKLNQGNLSSLLSGKRTKQGRHVRSVKGWSLSQD